MRYTPGMANLEDVTEIYYKRYGPGKFSDNVEEFVYESAMAGWADDTIGDEHFGTYDFIDFQAPIKVTGAYTSRGTISTGVWDFVAAIIFYRESGFVDVTCYDDIEEAKEDWKDLERKYEAESEEFADNPRSELVFHAKTRGGRYEIKAFLSEHGLYDIREYKHGNAVGVSLNHNKAQAVKRLHDAIRYSMIDGINYKVVLDDIGYSKWSRYSR
jgi:hypothetical protein